MRQLPFLLARNLSLFRKNWKNVLLCFITVFIVYGLYIIFLRDFMIQSVSSSGLDGCAVEEFTDRLMLSGLLIVVNTTTCFGIMQLCIHDAESGIRRDYLIAPIRKAQLLIGYWITSILVSFLYTCFAYSMILIYCLAAYQMILSLHDILISILILLISSILNSELLLCMITFIKDTTSFSTFGNLYGMLAGFLAGTYLPYDLYPEKLKQILFYYPPTHLTSFMRQIFLKDFESCVRIPQAEKFCSSLYQIYGVHLTYHQNLCDIRQHLLVLVISFAVMLLFLGIVHREN